MSAWNSMKSARGTNGAGERMGGIVVGLQESRRFMARTFEEGARADAALMASLEHKADRLADLLAAAPKHAA